MEHCERNSILSWRRSSIRRTKARLESRLRNQPPMKTKRQIIWIDDEPNRKKTADLLNESSTIPVSFRSMKNKDLVKEVEKILNGPQPSLVVLDHILDQTAT